MQTADDAVSSLLYASRFQNALPQLRPDAKRSIEGCLHNPLRELQRRLRNQRADDREYHLPLCSGVVSIPPRPPSLAVVAPTYESYEDEVLSFWGVWYVLCATVRFLRPIVRKRRFLEQRDHLQLQHMLAGVARPPAAGIPQAVYTNRSNPVRAAHKAFRSSLAASALLLRQGQCATLRAARGATPGRVQTAPHHKPQPLQLRPPYVPTTSLTPRPPTHPQVLHSYRPPTSSTLIGATCRQRAELGAHLFKHAETLDPPEPVQLSPLYPEDPRLPDELPGSGDEGDDPFDDPFEAMSFSGGDAVDTPRETPRRRADVLVVDAMPPAASSSRPFDVYEEDIDPHTRVPAAFGQEIPASERVRDDTLRWSQSGGRCDTSISISTMHKRRDAARRAVHEQGALIFAKERAMRESHRHMRRELLLKRLDTPGGGTARRQDLEGILRDTQAELQRSDTAQALQRVAEARSAWYFKVYQACVERFPFESARRVLYLLHSQLEQAGGSHTLGLTELSRLAACLSDDEISDVSTQYCLLQVCIAYGQPYIAFRELLEVRHAPYRLKGNGSSFA